MLQNIYKTLEPSTLVICRRIIGNFGETW